MLCPPTANEHNKGLRKVFGSQEIDKNLLQEEYLRLKAWVFKVKNPMKETLEWIEKLQTDLDEANTAKATLENQFKTAEDQVANLQCQVQELQSQA